MSNVIEVDFVHARGTKELAEIYTKAGITDEVVDDTEECFRLLSLYVLSLVSSKEIKSDE